MTEPVRIWRLLVAWLVCLPVFTSCIHDDLAECPQAYSVCFRYDYNMGFTDRFADEVDSLSVYVFDADGKYLRTFSDGGEALSKPGYRLPLPLDPGKYRLVAWAGLKEGCFEPSGMQAGVSGPEDLVVTLRCDGDGEVPRDKPLSPLWQAMQETVTVPQPGTEQTDTLRLIKDTNILRVILQRRDGATLHAADYDFSILCPHGNGRLAYDNTLLDCHPLVYRPYLQTEGTDGEGSGGAEAVSNVIAELSLSRLMENDAMRLHITDASGDVTLVDIPLVEYLLMIGREQDGRIKSDQEYLDRQDSYTITLFLKGEPGEEKWFDGLIIINGWALRPGSVDL